MEGYGLCLTMRINICLNRRKFNDSSSYSFCNESPRRPSEKSKAFFAPFKRGYEDQKWYYKSIKDVLETRIPNHPLLEKYRDVYEAAFERE